MLSDETQLTIAQAALLSGCTDRTLRRQSDRGKLVTTKVGRRLITTIASLRLANPDAPIDERMPQLLEKHAGLAGDPAPAAEAAPPEAAPVHDMAEAEGIDSDDTVDDVWAHDDEEPSAGEYVPEDEPEIEDDEDTEPQAVDNDIADDASDGPHADPESSALDVADLADEAAHADIEMPAAGAQPEAEPVVAVADPQPESAATVAEQELDESPEPAADAEDDSVALGAVTDNSIDCTTITPLTPIQIEPDPWMNPTAPLPTPQAACDAAEALDDSAPVNDWELAPVVPIVSARAANRAGSRVLDSSWPTPLELADAIRAACRR